MDLLIDILLDAGKDTLSLVPFLLVTYLALETLEHVAGDRVNGAIKRAGAAGPVVGSLLGMVPQCGFSAMAATLYAGRVVTLGTLVAVFLSTSDEMLPLLLAEQVPVQTMAMLLASKALIALVTGFIVDAAIRGLRRNARAHAAIRRTVLGTAANPAHVNCAHDDHSGGDIIDEVAEAGVSADHIHELCERDHCGCDEDEDERDHGHGHDHGHEGEHEHHHGHSHSHKGAPVLSIIRSAISHTVQVSVFIFLVTLILVAVLEAFGESATTRRSPSWVRRLSASFPTVRRAWSLRSCIWKARCSWHRCSPARSFLPAWVTWCCSAPTAAPAKTSCSWS